ncbi:hypothetical protein [Curtobacterium sp. MCPF17_046]|uniref:hypothetical protein n=1 Tax=Curtobacterium sp. MCPF17_046 TaxID=2175663 RepID=UPI000D81BCEF|nr:hypothetical protein [Curtobacterium sp. MCPF17_046]PYY34986.1 hypothetical protein DEJ32_14245 [Curtobacterium sp. MCPF17_046]
MLLASPAPHTATRYSTAAPDARTPRGDDGSATGARLRHTGPGRSELHLANGAVVTLLGPSGAFTGEFAPDHLERVRTTGGC